MKKNTNRFLIILWFTLFIISELLLIFNMTINLKANNWYIYLIDFILIGLVFLPIAIISIKFKNKGKSLILGYVLEAFFALAVFVSIAESTIDKDGTIKQVNNFLDFVTGKEKTDVAPDSFTIELIDIKDEYKINDVIKYRILVDNKEANISLAAKSKNNLCKIDTVNKTIECLANGDEEINFYSAIDSKISFIINLTINSKVITGIKLDEEKKDIFLDINQTYQLKNPILTPSDAEIIDYNFISSNAKVAIVNENGLIEAVGYGNAVIKCSSGMVSDSVYVCVGANTKFNILENKISIYPDYDNLYTLDVYVDNVASIDFNRLSYSYKSDYKISFKTGIKNSLDNFFTLAIYHKNTNLIKSEEIELEIKYKYKGGTIISDTLIVELLPYKDITVENIDLDNTNLNISESIYYKDNQLITKYSKANIIYKDLNKLNTNNYKFESETLDISNSVYDILIIDLNKSNFANLNHVVKFYPSKNIDEYIEFNIVFNKIDVVEDLLDIDFEFENLYSIDELKKNEIYYKYFDKSLFTNVKYNNEYYNNTGLKIELSDESLEYAEIEIDDLGILRDLRLLKLDDMGLAYECEIKFYISSLYDPNIKKEYVINIKSQYDDVLASIDNENYSDSFNASIYEGEAFNLTYKYIMNLEYKGSFQKNINPTVSIVGFQTDNENVITWKNNTKIIGLKKGNANLYIKLKSDVFTDLCTITINVTVDGPDDSVSSININKEIINYNDNCKPNLDEGYCSVGTTFKLYVDDSDNYLYKSSDESVLKIENGIISALKSGEASIIIQYKNNVSISTSFKLKVYDLVLPFEIVQGKFSNLVKNGNKYTVNARVGKQYQINLNIPEATTSEYFEYTTNNKNIELSQTGSVTMSKAGKYTITILNGENKSPYMEKVTLVINATKTGFSTQFVYFIRKLAGHFAVFMFTAIFGLMAIKITLDIDKKKRNKLFVLIALILYGFLIAISTELIQFVTPGRTCYMGDVWLNMSGYLTGVGIIIVIYFIIYLVKKIKNQGS